MAYFEYKAASATGEVSQGHMEADSREAVIRRLQAQGRIPIRAVELGAPGSAADARGARRRGGRVRYGQLGVLTLELATLLEAGLPLERALRTLSELAGTDAMHRLIERLRAAVRGGGDLSQAMSEEPEVFFPLYVNLVRAGEASGALDQALARLSEFMERSRELRDTVLQLSLYPAILLLLAMGSLALILTFVVPKFAVVFEGAGAALPLSTQIVMAIGDFIRGYWWALLAGLVAAALYVRYLFRNPSTRLQVDRMTLRLPLVGDFVGKLEVARFARALGTLLANGVPLLEALGIARQIVTNRVIAGSLLEVTDSVRAGQGMAGPLMRQSVFPELACHMLQVGEETGQLNSMLMKLAEIYDREVRTTLKRLVTIVEPLIILLLGGLVGGVIFSVVIAIVQVNELAF